MTGTRIVIGIVALIAAVLLVKMDHDIAQRLQPHAQQGDE